MLDLISLAFGGARRPAHENDAIAPEAMRKIVADSSHGNVRLQGGRYYTSEDVDAEFEALRGSELAPK